MTKNQNEKLAIYQNSNSTKIMLWKIIICCEVSYAMCYGYNNNYVKLAKFSSISETF